jgi:hypothetical protein
MTRMSLSIEIVSTLKLVKYFITLTSSWNLAVILNK